MTTFRSQVRSSQKGVVLFIALIVLVAMSLAGIAMVRSVDTALGIAGNIAFKEGTLQTTDKGVQAAYAWLAANAGGAVLQNTDAANGYYSNLATDPNWFDMASWGGAVALNAGTADAAGNTVRYIIHRMCTVGNAAYNATSPSTNSCAMYVPSSGGSSGGSMSVGSVQFQGTPQVYFRITTRVDGPRNTVSITQTSVLIDAT